MLNIEDLRFRQIDRRHLYGDIDGKRVWQFGTFALNVNELNCLSAAKSDGKIDVPMVAAVKVDGASRTQVGEMMPLDEALQKLNGVAPIKGIFGEFFSIHPGFFDAPF